MEQLLSTGQHKLTAADVNSLLGTASSERLVALVDHLAHRDAAAALLELDAVVAEGVDPGQLAEQLLGYFRDMMAAAVGCGRQQFRYAGPDDAAAISAAGERFGLETILAAIQILEQTLSRMRLSVHARTIAEAAVVRLCRLDDLDSLPALVAELRGGGPSAGRSPGAPGVPARGASVGPRTSNGPSSASSQQSTPPRDRAPRDRSAARHEQSTQPPRGSAAAGGEQSSSTGVLVAEASAERIAISPQTARRAWEAALAWLDEQSELVAVHAAKFDSMDYRPPEEDAPGGAGRMVVRFASTYTSCREFCQQPVQKAKLEEALTLVAGSPVLLEFAVSDAAAAQPAPQARALTRRQLEAEVVGRPFVQRAMELFDTTKIRVDPPTAS